MATNNQHHDADATAAHGTVAAHACPQGLVEVSSGSPRQYRNQNACGTTGA